MTRSRIRGLLRFALMPWVYLRYRPTVHGVLPGGPAILACNHAAFVDTVLLAVLLPLPFVVVGGHPRLYRNAWRRALLAAARVLPAEDAERTAVALLAAGARVLIYPEGGRRPEGLGDFPPLIGRIALTSGLPIVPMYLRGTTRGHRGAARLAIGAAITPEGDAEALTGRVREGIAALLRQHGPV